MHIPYKSKGFVESFVMKLIPYQIQKTLQIALNRVFSESKCTYISYNTKVCGIGF